LKEEIRVAVIAAALLAAGLLSWMVDGQTACRDYKPGSDASSAALSLKCNKPGLYSANQIALLFAMLPGFVSPHTAHQQRAAGP
jgi:hypothetical protein